jgi:hypothetical protein
MQQRRALSGARPVKPRLATMSAPKKPNNLKTGLIIGGLAVFFFAMVFIKRIWM